MTRSKTDVWVGVFVLVGAVALVFLSLKAANLLTLNVGGSTYRVTALFDNAGGLKPGAAVKSAGVLVGRVDSIGLDKQTFQARVAIQIDSRYAFPKDSSLKVLTSGLLGEQYVGVEPGGDMANWAPDAVVTQTQSAIVLENLIGQFLYNQASKAP